MDIELKIEEYRKILKGYVDYNLAKSIREELHKISKIFYVKKHTAEEYMTWIEKNMPIFRLVANQNQNQPFYMEMVSATFQFIHGDSVYECLDKAIKNN